ncbi:hypothetical protein ACFPVT_04360 [Corynebacterium choanae]|uniref:Secreted protein n=1 Tax=Corynebacterium choanae TaxID=1862358 RepID=A0A3G6J9I4_9CORY|nr:hypothetical protein [Corynebacterium choanae]AZA14432.1 hypothetical protein CCHOA_10245 [Corynebacterium choanae]
MRASLRVAAVAVSVSTLLLGGLPAAHAGDQAKVNEAVNKVNNLASLASFAPCSTVREKFASYGGGGVAKTRGDLEARSGSVIAGQIATLERRAGGLTPAQRQQYQAALQHGAQQAIARAVACGVVNGSGAVTEAAQAPVNNAPAPVQPAPAPAQPAPAPVQPAPAPAPQQTVLHNPLDPAHPIIVPFALPPLPEVFAGSSGLLPR